MNFDVRQLIGGHWQKGARTENLRDKYTGEVVGRVHCADGAQVDAAVSGVDRAQSAGPLAPPERQRILAEASRLVDERREELIAGMVCEAGFTRADASGEVNRAIETLRLSGEEAVRLVGDMVPMEGAPGGLGRIGFTMRVPVGVVCAITPFNSPLNTVAHKVGPAIAAGNSVVLKPSLQTPATAEGLVDILLTAGMPAERIALVHGPGETVGPWLLDDPRIRFYTFTGSTAVGEAISRGAGLRRTQLELGSLSSTVICEDADLDTAVAKCVAGAYRKAGQVCTSVQRLYVHRSVADQVTEGLLSAVAELAAGDPRDPQTSVGPLIAESEARRVESWVRSAAASGAVVEAGGERVGSVVTPTVLTGVEPDMQVMCQEVFGPVLTLQAYEDLDAAMREINATPYGLSAGIFTADLGRGLRAARELEMGSVHINETSSSRVDLMPYGGVKASGSGKEGPRYAAREMTEERLISITTG
ncbi:aldehyde dehydrogenase family protein [Georgenia sp. 10Sc9-8]|uniref:Aldehyde dehydrogenase family protein n=1 Tax=Georgenia halotolerans TaxID=3028317 RepID=A0ABT5U2Q0_9MICO|nr:aldehyde dehydrogenase family protein [Georgenia halotolerans]